MKHYLCMLIAALLLLSVSLCSCEEKVHVDVHLTYDETRGALVEDSLGLEYLWASVSYEPAVVTGPYADWDGMTLYTVKGWDPERLLTEEYTGIGGLLYAADKPLPALEDMNPNEIYVCTVSNTTMCILQIDNEDVVSEAVAYLTDGEQVALPENGDTTYYLKFLSDDCEGIYYNIVYIEVGEGEEAARYLYDRGTKRCVSIPYELFYQYLYSDEEVTLPAEENNYEVVTGDEEWEITFGN